MSLSPKLAVIKFAWSLSLAALLLGACSQNQSTPVQSGGHSGGAGGGSGLGGASTLGGSGSGGSSGRGGVVATGGTLAIGGLASTGGASATGGVVAAGGTTGTGGSKATGGSSAMGGSLATGGTAVVGGATAAGGTSGTGGATGPADAGPAADARSPDLAAEDALGRDTLSDSAGRDGVASDKPTADVASDGARPDSGASTCNLSGAATAQTPTVYVIGDSTASVYAGSLYPRMGWAQPLQDYFAPACATIQDKALSGRSSKSFYDEGAWTPIRNALKAGDFVLIQFGHNDEKITEAALGTDPFTTYEKYLSIYLDDAQAKGATPILLTSINRNSWSGGVLQDTHGDYPVAMRQLAQARQVSLVDATALTKTYFERIGQAATTKLFMDLAAGEFPNYPSGNTDNTHLQETGARTIAQMILADLYRQGRAPGTLAKAVPQAP